MLCLPMFVIAAALMFMEFDVLWRYFAWTNQTMATVEDCIRAYADILSASDSVETTLEWNPGNHFVDADKRTAKAFLWVMMQP